MWQMVKLGIACLALCLVAVAPPARRRRRRLHSRRRPLRRRRPERCRSPDHVVIVVLENKDEQDVMREAPYLAALARSGASLTDMHAETHPVSRTILRCSPVTPRASSTTAAR